MKTVFLKRTDAESLLVFFNGWGFDSRRAASLISEKDDILEVHDYTDFESNLPELLKPYRSLRLIAWSLGVAAAAHVFGTMMKNVRFESALALGGTLRPVDAECGIAPAVFDGTIANWLNPSMREKFYFRMTGLRDPGENFFPERSPEDQQTELKSLRNLAAEKLPNIYTQAVAGSRDRIFPPAAQKKCWLDYEITPVVRDLPHDPFFGLKTWTEVLNLGNP